LKAAPGTGFYFTGIVGANACMKPKPKGAPRHCDLSRGIVVDAASNTITFHLTAPDPDFLAKLAATPSYAVPSGTPLFGARLPLPATGPYMIESFDPKRGVRLVRIPGSASGRRRHNRPGTRTRSPSGSSPIPLLRSKP
jgi:peptide/nickel transport system substrate-binding protein